MKLSVIIVNYNVKYFLEQCLFSVCRALKDIDSEIFVADNNSVDGSCQMIRDKFRDVHLIENRKNLGFSRANNQAIRRCRGEYVLLLNPDTVVEEGSFRKCIDFMDAHPEAGGLGVKMIDGKGTFLPESKRALPTPAVAFCKIFGISKIFPRSKIFGKYHLGYLDPDRIHEVDVLPGAFMFLRKAALDKTGLLDEDFFMYGEDIDLSYRLIRCGYKNFYFPETTIIHYKGESTKKGSLNYVLQFYKAMITYAGKHFSGRNLLVFRTLINIAIYFRALLSLTKRIFYRLFLPLTDALIIYLGFAWIKPYWERIRFPGGGHYPGEFMMIIVPVYLLIWIFSILFSGGYERRTNLLNVARGIVTGTVIILIIYALLPMELRFSRAMILLGSAWGMVAILSFRMIIHALGFEPFRLMVRKGKRIIIAGKRDESARVRAILEKTTSSPNFLGIVCPGEEEPIPGSATGHLGQMEEIVRINRVEEIIFCSGDIPAQEIIRNMVALSGTEVDFKIAPPESHSIIGSNSIETTGDLYLIPLNSIAKPVNRKKKRLFDISASLILLVTIPVTLCVVRNRSGLLRNIGMVLLGKKTWIGYHISPAQDPGSLPRLRKGVLTPLAGRETDTVREEILLELNLFYAKDYRLSYDLQILVKGFRHLGS